MPRYRIEFELDYSDDKEVLGLTEFLIGQAPVLDKAGLRVVRETVRPWIMVEVLKEKDAPRRKPPKVVQR